MNIAIDLGKRMSYVVIEDDDKVVKEGYVETNKESFQEFSVKFIMAVARKQINNAPIIAYLFQCLMGLISPPSFIPLMNFSATSLCL